MLLLLVPFSAFSQSPRYDGPELPEGWYPVHETDLDEWQTELNVQKTEAKKLRTELATAKEQAAEAERQSSEARKAWTDSTAALNEAREYSIELERDVAALILQRNLAIASSVVLTIVTVASWFF